MKQLYLIGFMGSGKTTVSRNISEKFNINYIDLDKAIENNRKKSIVAIFKEEGEDAFRTYETEALIRSKNTPIIATGGGIIERKENTTHMKNTGIILYLKTSYHVIKERLISDHTRPLWRDENKNKELFQKRSKLYEQCADYIIDCDNLSVDEIIEEIVKIYGYKGFLEGEE